MYCPFVCVCLDLSVSAYLFVCGYLSVCLYACLCAFQFDPPNPRVGRVIHTFHVDGYSLSLIQLYTLFSFLKQKIFLQSEVSILSQQEIIAKIILLQLLLDVSLNLIESHGMINY